MTFIRICHQSLDIHGHLLRFGMTGPQKTYRSNTFSWGMTGCLGHFSKNLQPTQPKSSQVKLSSKNSGTPKSSIFIGVSLINHPFWWVLHPHFVIPAPKLRPGGPFGPSPEIQVTWIENDLHLRKPEMASVELWNLHPQKLTWNLEMMVSNRNLLFQVSIFGCHVSFRECNHFWTHEI